MDKKQGKKPAPESVYGVWITAKSNLMKHIGNLVNQMKELTSALSAAQEENEVLRMELAEARKEARTDPLTGLMNRRTFDEELARMLGLAKRGGRNVGLLVIDIDHFKEINDTRGHVAGDMVIRALAHVFRDAPKRVSDVVARVGGEEFAIIMPDTELHSAHDFAEKVRHTVEERLKVSVDGIPLTATISIGVALCQGESPKEAYKRADDALYDAKRSGRNRVCVASALQPRE